MQGRYGCYRRFHLTSGHFDSVDAGTGSDSGSYPELNANDVNVF
jgi:hypothetical protein